MRQSAYIQTVHDGDVLLGILRDLRTGGGLLTFHYGRQRATMPRADSHPGDAEVCYTAALIGFSPDLDYRRGAQLGQGRRRFRGAFALVGLV